jgi:predicted ATPase
MSHPGSDRLWIDAEGITRRSLEEIPHWQDMRRFIRDPEAALRRLLD